MSNVRLKKYHSAGVVSQLFKGTHVSNTWNCSATTYDGSAKNILANRYDEKWLARTYLQNYINTCKIYIKFHDIHVHYIIDDCVYDINCLFMRQTTFRRFLHSFSVLPVCLRCCFFLWILGAIHSLRTHKLSYFKPTYPPSTHKLWRRHDNNTWASSWRLTPPTTLLCICNKWMTPYHLIADSLTTAQTPISPSGRVVLSASVGGVIPSPRDLENIAVSS